MDPVEALAQLGGITSVKQWRTLTSRAESEEALAGGRVLRLTHTRVALPGADEARRAAAACGGVVSHLSAARVHGWKVIAVPELPCVTVRPGARTPTDRDRLELHWSELADSDVVDGVTTPVRTVIDCARVYPFASALTIADSALRQGAVDRAELLAAAHASPRTGRARAVRVATQAREESANPFESALRAIALDVPGLAVEPQGWIGTAGRVDLVDNDLLIAIEADSWEHHGSQEAFRHDVRRYAEFACRGWVVVRFVYEDVMSRPAVVRRQLERMTDVRRRQLRAGP